MTPEEYTRRRTALTTDIGSPIALAAHDAMQSKSDMAYPFMQEPNFFYLTGIAETGWTLVYDGETWHLSRVAVSDMHDLFDGSLSFEQASAISGIASVLSSEQAEALLVRLANDHPAIATLMAEPRAQHYESVINPASARLEKSLKKQFDEVTDCRPVLKKIRAIKSDEEIMGMRKAIDTTVAALQKVKANIGEYRYEYEIEADVSHAFRVKGAQGHAYEPIVASEGNACTLHYVANQAEIVSPALVLIDVGAEVEGYAADITRTFAIGNISDRQQAIHGAVEAAHKDIITLIKPGLSFEHYSKAVDEHMKQALQSVGLLEDLDDTTTYRTYFPHAISHGLGIDVHESLGGFDSFQAGMVLTVEPGIYIPAEQIGVRIEDDILVTADGNENLSAALPTSL